MNGKNLIIFFSFFLSFFLFAEDTDVPFVSSINARVMLDKVQINWKNPENFNKHLVIYRSDNPIGNTDELKNATLIVTLKNQEESYIDSPPFGTYYYTILIKNRMNQKLNIIFIPFRNYLTRGVIVKKIDIYRITKMSVISQNDAILVNWDYYADTTEDKNVIIYRYTLPLTDEERLSKAIKIAKLSIKDKQYFDHALANIHYYYAVFPEDIPVESFIPDININVEPVIIHKTIQSIDYFDIDSFVPLPLLALDNDPKSGKPFLDPLILKNPEKKPYEKKIRDIINNHIKMQTNVYQIFRQTKNNQLKHLEFHFLEDEEIFLTLTDNNAYIKMIQYLKVNDYENGEKYLKDLVEDTISDQLFERVSYYLGLLYYLDGNFYQAYLYLITPFQKYRKQILPYLESISFNIFESLER